MVTREDWQAKHLPTGRRLNNANVIYVLLYQTATHGCFCSSTCISFMQNYQVNCHRCGINKHLFNQILSNNIFFIYIHRIHGNMKRAQIYHTIIWLAVMVEFTRQEVGQLKVMKLPFAAISVYQLHLLVYHILTRKSSVILLIG